MATLPEMNLARMLDKMGSDLANDLEWALEQLMAVKECLPQPDSLAERYIECQRHLRHRRAYEASCDKAEAMRRAGQGVKER